MEEIKSSSAVNSINRGGQLGKSRPESKTKASRTGISILPGAHGFVPQNYYHIATIPASKVDKVVLTNSQIKEVDIIFGKYLI